jgi:hypothetical protein
VAERCAEGYALPMLLRSLLLTFVFFSSLFAQIILTGLLPMFLFVWSGMCITWEAKTWRLI